MGLHNKQRPTDGIHTPISYVYADATARNAASGFVDPDDLYKLAYQVDTGAIYILDGIGPETWTQINGAGGVSDHGALTGLADDDHTQYLLTSGARAMAAALDMGGFAITNVGNVDGVDVSAHAVRHERGGADEIDGDHLDIDFTPSNYTPSTAPAEAANVDDLAAHLSGIDTAIGAAGGGGGGTTFEMLTGFTSGNRYDADANGLGGVTTGFFAAALCEVLELNGGGGQTLFSNISFGSDGWQINVEADGSFQGTIIDTAGGAVGVTAASVDPLNDHSHVSAKHFLLILQVTQNGANNDLTFWVNGQVIDTTAGTNAYAPRTGTASIGLGAFGNVAAESGIAGVGYYEGTLTDDEIRAWTFECMAAGDLVDADNSHGWVNYSVKRGSPGAAWTESDGTGPDFSEVGSLTTVTRDILRFG